MTIPLYLAIIHLVTFSGIAGYIHHRASIVADQKRNALANEFYQKAIGVAKEGKRSILLFLFMYQMSGSLLNGLAVSGFLAHYHMPFHILKKYS